MHDSTPKASKDEALRRLSEAASPYRLRVVQTQYSELLVLFRPTPDGREVARLRYFEPDVGQPYMRSVIPAEVTATEQAEIERRIDERLAPVILDVFSFPPSISPAYGPEPTAPSTHDCTSQ